MRGLAYRRKRSMRVLFLGGGAQGASSSSAEELGASRWTLAEELGAHR
jgi:hypothetical protein